MPQPLSQLGMEYYIKSWQPQEKGISRKCQMETKASL